MEQVKKSDTWLRARTGRVRASLLLLWGEAWEQTPCGSLPDDDELLCLLLDMEPGEFAAMRNILLRGWWLADDGRLYHDTITARVLDMLKARAGNAKRVANHKQAKREQQAGNALPGQQKPSSNDTGTGTSTSTGTIQTEGGQERARAPEDGDADDTLPDTTGWVPTPGGAACKAIRLAGIPDVNPSHPDLQRLLAAGVTAQELADAARVLVGKGKASFAYLLSTVEGQRRDAAAKAAVPAEAQKPITVASGEAEKTAAMLAQQAAVKPTRPPAHLLALAGKAVRTA